MAQDHRSSFSLVSIIAFCGFGLLLALTFPLWWPSGSKWPEPLRTWLPMHPSAVSNHTRELGPTVSSWSEAEIRVALMQCIQSLAPINADLTPAEPLRDGNCGTPAPIRLSGINLHEKVIFDPPLLINCPMVVALHRWLNEVVQPAAKEAFGSPVRKVIGSSYACRNVYNLANGQLSQHALVNAVDLPIFVLANGRQVNVNHGWGPTARDLVATAKKPAAVKPTPNENHSSKNASTDLVKVSAKIIALKRPDAEQAAVTADATESANSGDAKFLRLAVQGACKIFSTVLSPEFNDVHRTHLHLDLQDRGSVNVCK